VQDLSEEYIQALTGLASVLSQHYFIEKKVFALDHDLEPRRSGHLLLPDPKRLSPHLEPQASCSDPLTQQFLRLIKPDNKEPKPGLHRALPDLSSRPPHRILLIPPLQLATNPLHNLRIDLAQTPQAAKSRPLKPLAAKAAPHPAQEESEAQDGDWEDD
jgi:hypothetical protein